MPFNTIEKRRAWKRSENGRKVARNYVRTENGRKRAWRARIKWEYGITVEQYDAMVAAQKNCCAICGATGESQRYGKLCIDHDHSTGRVRGLLCDRCNRGIALFDDSISRLVLAQDYLTRDDNA